MENDVTISKIKITFQKFHLFIPHEFYNHFLARMTKLLNKNKFISPLWPYLLNLGKVYSLLKYVVEVPCFKVLYTVL